MTKREKELKYKKMIAMAQNLKAVAEQQMIMATRIESEAKSALDELGVSTGQARRGKTDVLSESDKLELLGSLTTGRPSVAR